MTSPAAELRAAASRVRELGVAARARGPFSVAGRCLCDDYPDDEDRCEERGHRHSSWQVRTEVPHDPTWISYQVVETNCESDAHWLALLSPAVAEPLAAWLESEADEQGWRTEECVDCHGRGKVFDGDPLPFDCTDCVARGPLALARVLLGEAS